MLHCTFLSFHHFSTSFHHFSTSFHMMHSFRCIVTFSFPCIVCKCITYFLFESKYMYFVIQIKQILSELVLYITLCYCLVLSVLFFFFFFASWKIKVILNAKCFVLCIFANLILISFITCLTFTVL